MNTQKTVVITGVSLQKQVQKYHLLPGVLNVLNKQKLRLKILEARP